MQKAAVRKLSKLLEIGFSVFFPPYQQWQYCIPGLHCMAQLCAEGSYPAKIPVEKAGWRAGGVAAQGAVENMRITTILTLPEVWVRVSKGLKHVKKFQHRPEACCGVTSQELCHSGVPTKPSD